MKLEDNFMIKPTAVESLTTFQKNAKEICQRLKESGEPLVLTVNGKASLIVQDAAAYEADFLKLDRARERLAVEETLRQVDAGEVRPLEDFVSELRTKHDLPG